ncbi:MAG: RING finger domain-containing protein [Thermoplasmata archaeon]
MNPVDIKAIITLQLNDLGIDVEDEHLNMVVDYYNKYGSLPDIDYLVSMVTERKMNSEQPRISIQTLVGPPNSLRGRLTITNVATENYENDEIDNISYDEGTQPCSTNSTLHSDSEITSNSESQNESNLSGMYNVLIGNGIMNSIARLNNIIEELLIPIGNRINLVNIADPPVNDEVKKVLVSIDKIPLTIIRNQDDLASSGECLICYDPFVVTDLVRVLPCFHKFHRSCIDTYLIKESHLCPACRKPTGEHKLINI